MIKGSKKGDTVLRHEQLKALAVGQTLEMSEGQAAGCRTLFMGLLPLKFSVSVKGCTLGRAVLRRTA